MEQQEITVADGKYTVLIKETGGVECLRHGEPWRDCTGDSLIYALASELAETREKLAEVTETPPEPEDGYPAPYNDRFDPPQHGGDDLP